MLKLYLATPSGLTGTPFGMPPTAAALDAYLEILGDCPLPWAVSVVGGDAVASDVTRVALERGGHLHVGLEFFGGERTPTNVELVTEAVELCERVGRRRRLARRRRRRSWTCPARDTRRPSERCRSAAAGWR